MSLHATRKVSRLLLASIAAFSTVAATRAGEADLVKRAGVGQRVGDHRRPRALDRPIAVRDHWRENAPKPSELELPGDAKFVLMASKFDYVNGFQNIWDLYLLELEHSVSINGLARRRGVTSTPLRTRRSFGRRETRFSSAYRPRSSLCRSRRIGKTWGDGSGRSSDARRRRFRRTCATRFSAVKAPRSLSSPWNSTIFCPLLRSAPP